ncbi:hypothetical protein Sros01_78510 [Streptomyces roseochromogenus]|nr:hypothetical protein Sros01_78510 [Streptomyces roseochromogenus]
MPPRGSERIPRCSTLMAGSATVVRSIRSRVLSRHAEAVSTVGEFVHDAYPLPRRHPRLAPTAPERQAAEAGGRGLHSRPAAPGSAELLLVGQAVDPLVAKVDIKVRTKEMTAAVTQQTAEKATRAFHP